jgi:hypothetical protein
VPDGYVAVVRDIDITAGGGEIINFQVAINDLAKFWVGQFTDESLPQWASWRGRQVLQPGEILAATSDGSTDGLASGYLLLAT